MAATGRSLSALPDGCACDADPARQRWVDPQVADLLEAQRASGGGMARSGTVAEARRVYNEAAPTVAGVPRSVAEVRDLTLDLPGRALPGRLYRPTVPSATPTPALVYLHGGGWVLGGVETHDHLCRLLSSASGLAVVSVGYRLAPETPFPAGLEDADDALAWITHAAPDLGIDADAVAVGGDSAGANLATVVCRRRREAGSTMPVLQLLLYPVTAYEFSRPSFLRNGTGYSLTTADLGWTWHHYVGDPAVAVRPDCSPLLSDDLSGLPPALIHTAALDPLHDQGVAYARALEAAGVEVDLQCHTGMIHGFMRYLGVFDKAVEAVEKVGAELATRMRAR